MKANTRRRPARGIQDVHPSHPAHHRRGRDHAKNAWENRRTGEIVDNGHTRAGKAGTTEANYMNKAFLGIALAAHELWLRDDERGNQFCAPRGSNLIGSNLRGSNLRGSNLSGSDLRGSNLRGSNLSGSDLSDSNLRDSDLRGSNLSGSDLRGSNLRDSDLRDSDLRDSDLSGSNLSDSDLSGSNRIVGPQRSDGYIFTYCLATKTVRAGCQTKSIHNYIEHCNTYDNAEKKAETLAILKCLELLISARIAQ